jgi:hypothetical protein
MLKSVIVGTKVERIFRKAKKIITFFMCRRFHTAFSARSPFLIYFCIFAGIKKITTTYDEKNTCNMER